MSDQYIVSARKYRPATFASVVGQKSLTMTLKNAIDSNRLAQAYLFTGPRGVGKTSCARIFAKTINCLSPTPEGEACGKCASCVSINEGNSMNIIELDAASNNSVDDIRAINEQVNIPPQIGRYRVFIIDEVHMLSTAAFNAFLKTLEEPPKYVIFILATTEKHKVIPTILSRCQIYDFKRITISDIVEHLKYVAASEGIEADPAALNVVARKADGAMRDALSIFDQVSAFSAGHITYESTLANLNVLDYDYYFRLIESFRAGDVQQSLMIYKEVRDKGFDSQIFLNGLGSHIRDLMVAADPATMPLLEVAEEIAVKYSEQAKTLPLPWYYTAMKLVNDSDLNYRTATNKQFLVELLLIRLCQLLKPLEPPFSRVDVDIPLKRIEATPVSTPSVSNPPTSSGVSTDATLAKMPKEAVATKKGTNPEGSESQSQPGSEAKPESKVDSKPESRVERPRVRRPAGTGGTMRLSDIKAEAIESTRRREEHRQPVATEGFVAAWEQFQRENPEKQRLLSAMRLSKVRQKSGEVFIATIDHPGDRQVLDQEMGTLLGYIREEVSNDFVTIELELDTSDVVKKLPPAELLKEMISENPALATLLSNIDAELA